MITPRHISWFSPDIYHCSNDETADSNSKLKACATLKSAFMTAENVFQEMKTKTDVLNGIISLKEREIGYQLELKQLYQKLVDIIVADESSYTLRSSDPREH